MPVHHTAHHGENLSTAALLCAVIFFMMVIGRVPARQLGKLIGGVVMAVVVVVSMVMIFGKDTEEANPNKNLTEQLAQEQTKDKDGGGIFHRFDTWKSRIDKFLNSKEVPPEKFDLDKDGQVGHANIAIASSNIVGKGPGNSVERDFLSQAFSDFIYAIIIEETGILGAFFVAMLYIILLFRTGRIANRCENNFPAFLAMGLALLLVTQALFNMCVAVGWHCHRTTTAACQQGWHIEHSQLYLYRGDTQREQVGQEKCGNRRRERQARHGNRMSDRHQP
jgi:cell division protein FtsW